MLELMTKMYKEDLVKLRDNHLNFERTLWIASLISQLCQISKKPYHKLSEFNEKIVQDFYTLFNENPSETRIAPYILVGYKHIENTENKFQVKRKFTLSIIQLAQLHLFVGKTPPSHPSKIMVWGDVCEAMQMQAPRIQEALMKGPYRKALWRLLLSTEAEVNDIMKRKAGNLDASFLMAKTQIMRLNFKQQNYYEHIDENEDAVQEVDLSKDLDRMRLMEEEYERMLGSRNPKIEVSWDVFDPTAVKASPIGTIVDDKMPTLHTCKAAVKERGIDLQLSKKLLISSNLLSTFIGESNCLFTENQKPIHRSLFIRDGSESKMVLVSENDARQLKEHLVNFPDEKGSGIYLVETSGAINQRASKNEKVYNLWQEGNLNDRKLLLLAMIVQGGVLQLENLPIHDVKNVFAALLDEMCSADPDPMDMVLDNYNMNFPEFIQTFKDLTTEKPPKKPKINHKSDNKLNQRMGHLIALRQLFEMAVNSRPEDMNCYRKSKNLRVLFLGH